MNSTWLTGVRKTGVLRPDLSWYRYKPRLARRELRRPRRLQEVRPSCRAYRSSRPGGRRLDPGRGAGGAHLSSSYPPFGHPTSILTDHPLTPSVHTGAVLQDDAQGSRSPGQGEAPKGVGHGRGPAEGVVRGMCPILAALARRWCRRWIERLFRRRRWCASRRCMLGPDECCALPREVGRGEPLIAWLVYRRGLACPLDVAGPPRFGARG